MASLGGDSSSFMGDLFSLKRISVVALRVVRQLKRDRRTIGLITFAPIFLMVLFGYALSGEMSGIALGVVDEAGAVGWGGAVEGGGSGGVRSHLQAVDDFELLYLASESDAWKLIAEGRLDGAVVLEESEVRLLLDASSPQIANAIIAEVNAGVLEDERRKAQALEGKKTAISTITTRYVYGYDLEMIDFVGPAVLGLVVFFFTFIMTTVSFLRERTLGTLEKFMVSPLSKTEMISGYMVGFSFFSILQSATTLIVVVTVFGVPLRGNPLSAFAVILLLGAGALVLGAFLSNFARSEFQVVQFIPIVILPQVVLSGVWWPLESIPEFIRPISYILPLTYSSDALRAVMLRGASITDILVPDLLALCAFFALMFFVATVMLRREVG
jgi:ABC-2 type transport system permease protein